MCWVLDSESRAQDSNIEKLISSVKRIILKIVIGLFCDALFIYQSKENHDQKGWLFDNNLITNFVSSFPVILVTILSAKSLYSFLKYKISYNQHYWIEIEKLIEYKCFIV